MFDKSNEELASKGILLDDSYLDKLLILCRKERKPLNLVEIDKIEDICEGHFKNWKEGVITMLDLVSLKIDNIIDGLKREEYEGDVNLVEKTIFSFMEEKKQLTKKNTSNGKRVLL